MTADPLDARIHHPIAYPLARCPACGSSELEAVVEDVVEAVHFLCQGCDRCWNVELGYVRRGAPATCFGCTRNDACSVRP
jgi:transposase-like protein